jgi:hypothetical protein
VIGPSVTSQGPALELRVNGVDNSGTLTLSDGTALTAGGKLRASVDNSQFTALSSTQSGGGPASVELGSDIIPGKVGVLEGAGGDSIVVDGDTFGSTLLEQGFGPDTGSGDGGSIVVDQSHFRDLTIVQGNGQGDSIDVNDVTVSTSSFGLRTSQGNGTGDVTTINAVTAPGPVTPSPVTIPSILAIQGNSTQGKLGGDTATVSHSSVPGNITIDQGNGSDFAAILNSSAGFAIPVGPYLIEDFGTATISQGDGDNDVALLDEGDVFNNVVIAQGNGQGDIAQINDTTVFSDIDITQGNVPAGSKSSPDVGNSVVAIGFDYIGFMGSSSVTAGGATSVYQYGANNQVYLGDTPSSFTTVFLDIYTGAGGGGFVSATNTTVYAGSSFGYNYVINGGGTGNTYYDGGGNSPGPLPYGPGYSG